MMSEFVIVLEGWRGACTSTQWNMTGLYGIFFFIYTVSPEKWQELSKLN